MSEKTINYRLQSKTRQPNKREGSPVMGNKKQGTFYVLSTLKDGRMVGSKGGDLGKEWLWVLGRMFQD
jgi:hypothetical protein